MRQALVVLLITSILHSQTGPPAQTAGTEERQSSQSPRVETYRYYNVLRRGTREEACVLLLLQRGFLSVPGHPVAGIQPTHLDLLDGDGLTFSRFRYPSTYMRKFAFESERIPVGGGLYFPITFRVHAESHAQLGPHLVHAKLTYQVVDNAGISSPQTIDLVLRVNVVDHGIRVRRDKEWPFQRVTTTEVMLMIVLSPILIPMGLVCAIFLDGCG